MPATGSLFLRATLMLIALCAPAVAAPPAPRNTDAPPVTDIVAAEITVVLDELASDGDFHRATDRLDGLFDRVIAHVPDGELEALTRTAVARRMVQLLAATRTIDKLDTLNYLRQNRALAATVATLITEADDVDKVYALLNTLREKYGDKLNDYANLAAAICVVHDRSLTRQINENKVTADDPTTLFEYFVRAEKHLFFGSVKDVPAELLVWTVDATASVTEMVWALERFHGDREVGNRFYDIQYDYAHFHTGAAKKVTLAGFNLPNIQTHGGVCADQAYFAMSVGKAIGVPTAYTVGMGADVGHAWVTYLKLDPRRKTVRWVDVGRYEAYQGVRGQVVDPQTGQTIPDSYMTLTAELVNARATPAQRQAAVAYTDAAVRLASIEASGREFAPAPLLGPAEDAGPIQLVRGLAVTDQLHLLELALNENRAYVRAWMTMRDMAESDRLSLDDKRRWADVLQRMCGDRYPDFTLDIFLPMIESVDDLQVRGQLYDKAAKLYPRRHDLVARVLMAHAAMWEAQDEPGRAADYYQMVINRFANAGPFVLDAVKRIEVMLIANDKSRNIPVLYEQTWAKVQKPRDMAPQFATQSNWYRVGMMYAAAMEAAGGSEQADKLRHAIAAELTKGQGGH